jgi:hypothetical protein
MPRMTVRALGMSYLVVGLGTPRLVAETLYGTWTARSAPHSGGWPPGPVASSSGPDPRS